MLREVDVPGLFDVVDPVHSSQLILRGLSLMTVNFHVLLKGSLQVDQTIARKLA